MTKALSSQQISPLMIEQPDDEGQRALSQNETVKPPLAAIARWSAGREVTNNEPKLRWPAGRDVPMVAITGAPRDSRAENSNQALA